MSSKKSKPAESNRQESSHGDDANVGAEPSFVVAIGASAGGLESLERFFKNCPADSGAAFVVIQHLSPDHKSMMHDLLSRYTSMKVKMVTDGMLVSANTVFLIPPGTIMRIASKRFQLTPKIPHFLTLPIDIFLSSLADDCGSKAVGVILSGTGSDGTRGAVALNAAGGLLMAQDPHDAKFDGMPSSVIGTGLVDAILPAEELGARLISHIRNLPISLPAPDQKHDRRIQLSVDDASEGIVQLLLQYSGIDFHDYKPATLIRRIERRMQVRHMKGLNEYLMLLEQDRDELATLRRELLIPVTSFFRDADAFSTLDHDAVSRIVSSVSSSEGIRVWVAGTSTGEEAYSIAMLFIEAFERERKWPNLKVFATDVSQQNIDFAAAGRYPESAAAELTPGRIERFFNASHGQYTVKPELRQCIVFARHNLLTDPPFTRMNLVSCRNLLIYFTNEAQKRALNRLQYSIQSHGYLFLGSSESLAGQSTGFSTIHSKHKLFQRTGQGQQSGFGPAISDSKSYVSATDKARRPLSARIAANDGATVDDATVTLLNEYAPPSMLINDKHEVVHLFGKVQPYFRAREGSATLDLNRLLPDCIVPVATALLFKVAKEKERMVSDLLRVPLENGSIRTIRLGVRPMPAKTDEVILLLSFEELATISPDDQPETVDVNVETVARMDVLERELVATRESLQATIEELETSNEELQATNEELMASNEELQSSNEELQSVNEELNTVNAEFQEKVLILNRVNADLDSMSKAVGVATIFVDGELNLTRFSPEATGIFRLREGDVGRPLEEITHVLKYPQLIDDLSNATRSDALFEKEVVAKDGRLFLVRLLPYGSSTKERSGAVATFIDISDFRDRKRLQDIIDALPEHIAVLDTAANIVMVNEGWNRFRRENTEGGRDESDIGKNYIDACKPIDGTDKAYATHAAKGVKAVLNGSSSRFSMQYPCHSPTEKRWFVMNVSPIQGHGFGAVVSHTNITAWYESGEGPSR